MAVALVDLASEACAQLGASRIEAVHVAIGPLSGIVEDALAFSFELAATGTSVEGARLCFERVPLILFCATCQEEKTVATPQHLRCRTCGAPSADVRSGRDLRLTAVEVPDVPHSPDSTEHPEEERSSGG